MPIQVLYGTCANAHHGSIVPPMLSLDYSSADDWLRQLPRPEGRGLL